MSVLAFIPARAGSKGLPNKNILPFCGRPLLEWTIEQAKRSAGIDLICVSTDSEEYAGIAKSCGIDMPFLRPAEYAHDSSRTVDAVFHALREFERRGKTFELIALLEPTSPLRKPDDIDHAICNFAGQLDAADAMVSIGEIQLENPFIAKTIKNEFLAPLIRTPSGFHQRQQLPTCYFPYGVIYLIKTSVLVQEETFYPARTIPFPIERWQNYEIDDACDFICSEQIFRHHLLQHYS